MEDYLSYAKRHPVLLSRDHKVVELLIIYEHVRLIHAGCTEVSASRAREFCIVCECQTIRGKVCYCVTFQWIGARAKPLLLRHLPREHLNPVDIFKDSGVDYARPLCVKRGSICKAIFMKCYMYVAVFMSLSVKVVHL